MKWVEEYSMTATVAWRLYTSLFRILAPSLVSMAYTLVNVDVDEKIVLPSGYSIDMSREKQRNEEYRSLTIFPPHHSPARLAWSQLAQAEGYNTVSETAALFVRWYMQLRVIAEISPCAASLI